MTTLFLVTTSVSYEGTNIASCHTTAEAAVAEAERLTTVCQNDDFITVKAIAPGPGPGIRIAEWAMSWPDWIAGWISLDHGDLEAVWRRTL